MTTTTLGRTNLTVTTAGLGCGGFSRIGIDKGIDHAAGIVRRAYDEGVTFFDTATAYGTQPAVGQGLHGLKRDSFVISTKFPYRYFGRYGTSEGSPLMTPADLEATLETSLRELQTDYIDVWHCHALTLGDFPYVRDELYPVMLRAKERGLVRFLGVTEQFGADTSHVMLKSVLHEDLFDVVMVGYNILNPSAADTVLPLTIERDVAVLCMFAVRRALHDDAQLARDLAKILENSQGGADLTADPRILDFLLQSGVAQSLPEAAYRFTRHTRGITVTLTGTGNAEHLAENLRSIELPPLPDSALQRLHELFGSVDCVSGQ
ncbi:MAG: aldo/keto reductase [Oscillospiraceae bacterium]|jgi:aryl-alcohol dehydrogenase-like predicted oxidoreductase|nr:aldo/keto reductase [Oscillospiraceae bacterium]